MSRPIRPLCVKCEVEFAVKKNSQSALLTLDKEGNKPFELYNCDVWECPICGFQIVGGFGQNPVAVHFTDDFENRFKNWTEKRRVFLGVPSISCIPDADLNSGMLDKVAWEKYFPMKRKKYI